MLTKRRPELVPENYRAVYDFYAARSQAWYYVPIVSLGKALIQPDVHLSPEIKESVLSGVKAGKGVIAVANHPGNYDPFIAAAAMTHFEEPKMQRFTALAKYELFKNPFSRLLFEGAGSLPVFRTKGFANDPTHLKRTLYLQYCCLSYSSKKSMSA